jgi:hypothetical protein
MKTIQLLKWNAQDQEHELIYQSDDAKVKEWESLQSEYALKTLEGVGIYEVLLKDIRDADGNDFDLIDSFYTNNVEIEAEWWEVKVYQ